MKPIFYLFLLVLASCGGKQRSVDYGKTTVTQLKAVMGEPIQEQSVPVENSKVLVYEDNEKFQIKDDVVTNSFRNPAGNEKQLLYWKHKFQECETITTQISKGTGHELPQYELKCPAEGLSVVYYDGSSLVERVVEHEKK